MDYGILSKKGLEIFLIQLPAVALIHGSINGDKVVIKENHVKWLYDLYVEELNELGLNQENEQNESLLEHAKRIILNADKEAIEILQYINQYGSQAEIERKKIMGRNKMWRTLKHPIPYSINYVGEDKITQCYYSFIDGSVKKDVKNSSNPTYEQDFLLDSLNRKDGSFTSFGRILLKLASNRPVKVKPIKKENDDLVQGELVKKDNN